MVVIKDIEKVLKIKIFLFQKLYKQKKANNELDADGSLILNPCINYVYYANN